jgi:hypothetical protein
MPALSTPLSYALWLGTIGVATTVFVLSAGGAMGIVRDEARLMPPAAIAPAQLRNVPAITPAKVDITTVEAKVELPEPPVIVSEPPPPVPTVEIDPTPHMQVIATRLTVHAEADGSSRSVGVFARDDVVDYLALSGSWALVQRGALFGWVPGAALLEIERRPAA